MAVYSYKAIDRQSSPVRGSVIADTPRQARDQLRTRGLSVLDIFQQKSRTTKSWVPQFLTARLSGDISSTIRDLSTLLDVGIPLTEALDTLAKQNRRSVKTALLHVRDRVAGGMSLAQAMSEQPQLFDSLCVHMVEVGETSGTLESVLSQLADFKLRSSELKDRILTALLYPAIVLLVSIVVSLFLMTVVVPMLLTSLVESGRILPWPTRILQSISLFVVDNSWSIPLAIFAAVLSVLFVLGTNAGRKRWHMFLLRLPVIGTIAQKQVIARTALVVATLMRSGIVFLKAIEIAARITPNLVFRDALEQTFKNVNAGQDISTALEKTQVFPPLVVQLFSVGQKTGRLDEMLQKLSADYDRQVAGTSARLAAALEPILILILSVVVGFILFATLLPILDAGNVL